MCSQRQQEEAHDGHVTLHLCVRDTCVCLCTSAAELSQYKPSVQLLPVQWDISIGIWSPFPLDVPACLLGLVLNSSRLSFNSSLLRSYSVDTSAPTWVQRWIAVVK